MIAASAPSQPTWPSTAASWSTALSAPPSASRRAATMACTPVGRGGRGRRWAAGPGAAVAQHAHVLLGEQRVAADPAEQGRVDLGGQAVVGQQGGQQAGGVGVAQGVEADGGPAGAPAGPALQQLRPGGGQDQDGRRAGVPVAEALDEVEQGVVGPVQVLQGQDQRPGRGQAVQEAPPGGELLLAVGGGGRPGAPRAAAADADQAAQVTGDPGGGDRLGHRARGRDQPPSGELGAVALQDAGLGLDRLGQRPEGRPVAIGEGPPLPPGEPRGATRGRRSGGRPARPAGGSCRCRRRRGR